MAAGGSAQAAAGRGPSAAGPADGGRKGPHAEIPRIVSAGLEASLERFSDPQLLADGKVNLVSLEAVEQRFGRRWPLRQEQVYDFAHRVLERGLGAHGLYLRVSETDYLIIHPDRGRLSGQAACLTYLREILHHFLGESHMADVGVLQVTKIAGGALQARQVDAAAADKADRDVEPAAPAAEPAAAAAERSRVDNWTPFVAGDGRTLRVSTRLEPVFELKGFSRIGFRMIPRVVVVRTDEEVPRSQLMNLGTADVLQVDLATVARGMDRLRAESAGEQQLSLVVPLSYTSLASQRGRVELVKALKEASGMLRCGVICEICDIEGVPAGALLSAASLIRPFTLLVVGRVARPRRGHFEALRDAGLNALSLDCPPNLADEAFAAWAAGAIPEARRVVRSVLVYGVESPRRAAELAMLGVTHASLNIR